MKAIAALVIILVSAWSAAVSAHCDTLDGPVVSAARKALDTGNVNLVLVWVRETDEPEIRQLFDKVRVVRRSRGEAQALAERYFFETLVRLHRTGEGAPYTGLKAAGEEEPAIAAADQAIASGNLQRLSSLISQRVEKGLHAQFEALMAKRHYAPNDVAAGRAYSSAYVEFVHYAERLHDAAETLAADHAH